MEGNAEGRSGCLLEWQRVHHNFDVPLDWTYERGREIGFESLRGNNERNTVWIQVHLREGVSAVSFMKGQIPEVFML